MIILDIIIPHASLLRVECGLRLGIYFSYLSSSITTPRTMFQHPLDPLFVQISPSGAARRGPGQVAAGAGVSSQTSNSASVDWGEGRGARLTNGLYNQ